MCLWVFWGTIPEPVGHTLCGCTSLGSIDCVKANGGETHEVALTARRHVLRIRGSNFSFQLKLSSLLTAHPGKLPIRLRPGHDRAY